MLRYRRIKTRPRQSSSWRRLKTQFKLKKFFRRVALALTVILAVALTLGTIYVWKFFTEPFASASSTFQNKISWDGETPFNLLLEDANLSILTFNPTQKTFTIINLPSSSEGLAEDKDKIDRLARKVTNDLGIPINGYVLADGQGLAELGGIFPQAKGVKDLFNLSNVPRLPAVWGVIRKHFTTTLDLSEIFRALFYLILVRADRIDTLTVSPELLSDQEKLDHKLSPFLRDEKIVAEHLKIQVLNGSGKPGVAASATRLIRNIGGEVIRMDNFERTDLVKGYLLLDSSGSYTARRLAQIFSVADSRPPRTGSEARADITLILGAENYR